MARFIVWIVSPRDVPHTRCFAELAASLASALRQLGHGAEVAATPEMPAAAARLIVLGAHFLGTHLPLPNELPSSAILYNLEQCSAPVFEKTIDVARAWPGSVLWDYSERNRKALREMGGLQSVLCRVGWDASLERPRMHTMWVQPIDVLVYGSMSVRRGQIIRELERAGWRVTFTFGMYGDVRDYVIASSRLVLNVHREADGVFEVVRCQHLLANRIPVVSEGPGIDPDLEAPFKDGIVFAPYERLVDAVSKALASEDPERRRLARRGYEALRAIPVIVEVERALKESGTR